ncbi:MAG: transketolase [archaeon]
MDQQQKILKIKKKALEIRKRIVHMVYRAGSGHPGGSLSCADVVACLYFPYRFSLLNVKRENPKWEERDYLVLSKGHACPAVYAALAMREFFKKEHLYKLRKVGALLQGHAVSKVPGVDVSTGSLGQGLSVACGIALGLKKLGKNSKVFAIVGDGECQEGQIWEAANFAVSHKLDNLIVFVDHNHKQIMGSDKEVINHINNLRAKFSAFGWDTLAINGHNIEEIIDTTEGAKKLKNPVAIVMDTIKGKGVSVMEKHKNGWHGSPISFKIFRLAMKEFKEEEERLKAEEEALK